MALDVETPVPPDQTNRGVPDGVDLSDLAGSPGELRREELEEILRDGAWNEAFNEWATYTGLTEDEFRAIDESGVIEELDFFWDPTDERLRFDLPELPRELSERSDLAPTVRVELSDLGDTVIEMIETGYDDWSDGETEHWTEEAFDEEPTGEG